MSAPNRVSRMLPHKVTDIWAYVCVGDDGDEGIPAFTRPRDGTIWPLLGSDRERVELLRPIAQSMATDRQQVVLLRHFTLAGLDEVISP